MLDHDLHVRTLWTDEIPSLPCVAEEPETDLLRLPANTPGERLRALVFMIVERHLVTIRRHLLGHPRPWSVDPAMRQLKLLNSSQFFDYSACELRDATWRHRWSPDEWLVQAAVFRSRHVRGWFQQVGDLPPATVPVADYDPQRYLELLQARAEVQGTWRRTAYRAWLPGKGQSLAERLAFDAIPRIIQRAPDAVAALREARTAREVLWELTRFASLSRTEPTQLSFAALQLFRDLVQPGPASLGLDLVDPTITDDQYSVLGDGAAPTLAAFNMDVRTEARTMVSLARLRDTVGRHVGHVTEELASTTWSEVWPSWMPTPYPSLSDIESAACEFRKLTTWAESRAARRAA
jgi:hypothetical protein